VDTFVISAYCLLTLMLMFGGRQRRTFAEASHTAAALIVGTLCLAAFVFFVAGSFSHFIGTQDDEIAVAQRSFLESDR
jgi:hypothetical protein